jgi:hypothetical protein
MDDGFSVEIIEVGEEPCFEFLLGCDANAAEHGSSHFGEAGLCCTNSCADKAGAKILIN